MGSIKDKLISKVLINDRVLENLKMSFQISLNNKGVSGEKRADMFREMFLRNLCREHLYYLDKAKDVLSMKDTLEEAKKYM